MSAFRACLVGVIAAAAIFVFVCPGTAQEPASGPAKELAAPPPATIPNDRPHHMGPKNCAYWNERYSIVEATQKRIGQSCADKVNEFYRACALSGAEEALENYLNAVSRLFESNGDYGYTTSNPNVPNPVYWSNDPCDGRSDSCKNCYQMWKAYGFPSGETLIEFLIDFIRKNPGKNPFLVDWGLCTESLSLLPEPGRDVQGNVLGSARSETVCDYELKSPLVAVLAGQQLKCETRTSTRTNQTKELPSWATAQNCFMVLEDGKNFVEYISGIQATCSNADLVSRTLAYIKEQMVPVCEAEMRADSQKEHPARTDENLSRPVETDIARPGADVVNPKKDTSERAAGAVNPQTQTGQPGVEPASTDVPLDPLLPRENRMQITLGNFGCGAVTTSVKQCRDVCERGANKTSNLVIRAYYRTECQAECNRYEARLVSLCLPALDVVNQDGSNSAAGACSARSSAVQQCRNICEMGAGNVSNFVARAVYRRDCQTKCDDLDSLLVELCERDKNKPDSIAAQPGVTPASTGDRIGKKYKAKRNNNSVAAVSAGIAPNNKKAMVAKKKKPLPPSPCRDGERSCIFTRGSTGSPGVVATTTASPGVVAKKKFKPLPPSPCRKGANCATTTASPGVKIIGPGLLDDAPTFNAQSPSAAGSRGARGGRDR